MNESTKRYLKAAGCVVVGVSLVATGQFFLSSAIGIALMRSGKIAIPTGVPAEAVLKLSSTSMVVADAVRVASCFIAGHSFLKKSGRELNEAVAAHRIEKGVV